MCVYVLFFSSRRRHTRCSRDWSSDVCSSDLLRGTVGSLVAFWAVEGIARFIVAHLPHGAAQLVWNVSPDLRVWGYSLGLTAFTGIVFGLAPALHEIGRASCRERV